MIENVSDRNVHGLGKLREERGSHFEVLSRFFANGADPIFSQI
jgi:hypothetical protein